MKVEELHDCEKCHGKIVLIEIDKTGNTYCGYCHEKVDYTKLHSPKYKKLLREKYSIFDYIKEYPDNWRKLCEGIGKRK